MSEPSARPRYVAVEALDGTGRALASSGVVQASRQAQRGRKAIDAQRNPSRRRAEPAPMLLTITMRDDGT